MTELLTTSGFQDGRRRHFVFHLNTSGSLSEDKDHHSAFAHQISSEKDNRFMNYWHLAKLKMAASAMLDFDFFGLIVSHMS